MNKVNSELLEKRLVELVYMKEVLIPKLNETIHNAEVEYNPLIEMFKYQFYNEIHSKLEKKYKLFGVYLEDLTDMKIAFDEQIELEKKLNLNDFELEFESLLINVIAEVSVLLETLKIEMEEIQNKIKERKNEKDS